MAQIHIAFVPDRLGAHVSVITHLTVGNTDGALPSPIVAFDQHLPAELELIGSTLGLAICKPATLLADGLSGCPPNALLGAGTATVAVPFGPEIVTESAAIHVLMGPPAEEQVGVLLFAESLSPVFAQQVFPGVILIGSGPESLDTTFPPTPTLPGAPDAAMINMSLEVGPAHLTYYKRVHGNEVGYRPQGIALPSKCPPGGFLFVTDMRFLDGTTLRVPDAVPCPPAQPTQRRHAGKHAKA